MLGFEWTFLALMHKECEMHLNARVYGCVLRLCSSVCRPVASTHTHDSLMNNSPGHIPALGTHIINCALTALRNDPFSFQNEGMGRAGLPQDCQP